MSPEQEAIIKALLMQGQMTPTQKYGNAINNDQRAQMLPTDGRVHPNRMMYAAGQPVAREPFHAREALSAPMPQGGNEAAPMSALKQRQMAMQAQRAAEDQRALQADPAQFAGQAYRDATGDRMQMGASVFEQMFRDMSPEEQQQVMQKIQAGMSPQEALAPAGFTTRR